MDGPRQKGPFEQKTDAIQLNLEAILAACRARHRDQLQRNYNDLEWMLTEYLPSVRAVQRQIWSDNVSRARWALLVDCATGLCALHPLVLQVKDSLLKARFSPNITKRLTGTLDSLESEIERTANAAEIKLEASTTTHRTVAETEACA